MIIYHFWKARIMINKILWPALPDHDLPCSCRVNWREIFKFSSSFFNPLLNYTLDRSFVTTPLCKKSHFLSFHSILLSTIMPTILEKIAEIEAEVCPIILLMIIHHVQLFRWLVLKGTRPQPTILVY